MIDFSKLMASQNSMQVEPRNIFMGLPTRDKRYEYPRDVQTEVWKQWYEIRNNENCIIKMNTGSGKTVVGLIILKSCLNEEKGPAVFVVPDSYLVQQVCREAKLLGVSVTTDPDDISFLRKQAILVINIHTLVNGKSKFGMRPYNNIDIGSIIIDDVHACLATIESQYRINIPSSDTMYKEMVDIFSASLKEQSENKYSDIVENSDPLVNMLVPFWAWQSKQQEVYTLLSNKKETDYIEFNFPLLKDCLPLCNCMVSAKCVEITPPCVPIHKIRSFVRAKRKIFMSATLLDDSAFVTALDIKPEKVDCVISPEKANDIGDRLILFPQVMNKDISDQEIKSSLKEMAQKHNVVVIVPSNQRAKYWSDVADLTLNSKNIDDGVKQLKNNHIGLTVLVNKYDGIDLPDDSCRILVIDGLPKMRSEYDCFEQNANPLNKRLCSEQIQKIEQGMGRGVRSNTDYCTIVLMGRGLADIIYTSDGYNYFSEATRTQFQLSEKLWEQLKTPTIDDVMALAEYSLIRNIDWVSVSKEALSSVKYLSVPNFSPISIAERNAFNLAELGRYQEAVEILQNEKNKSKDPELKGLIKQSIAAYVNFYNSEDAQQVQLSAYTDNRMVLHPIKGIQFEKIMNKTGVQAQFFVDYVAKKSITANKYILRINSLIEKLVFEPDTSKTFERAFKDISFLLGIYSNRPEDEYGKGSDNFWDVGNSTYFVIECKNGAITETIGKHDCNQLNGSINWFNLQYPSTSCSFYPIMIHNSRVFEYDCSPDERIRIMTPSLLEKFKSNILKFAENAVKPDAYNNTVRINQLLDQFKLLGIQIVENYTTGFTVSRR